MEFGIRFGALADPLLDQIKSQGLKYNKATVERLQTCMDSLMHLRFNDLVTDSMHEKIMQKLYKKIVSHIKQQNKLKELP